MPGWTSRALARLRTLGELLGYLARRRLFFFVPLVLVLLLAAVLLLLTEGLGYVAPFVYTIF